jgi:hypothetical protein
MLAILILVGCTAAEEQAPEISTMPEAISKPIIFDETRRQLSLQYLKDRYGLEQREPTITPKMVVLHWTVIPTMEETFTAFNPAQLPGRRQDVMTAGALNVSSHYLVDRDGTIYQLLPELTLARHVIGLNHSAIGIENVGGGAELPLTNAQLASNVAIVRYLAGKYDIGYLIGHYEYAEFDGHPLWLEKDSGYRTEKTDPGKRFMERIRVTVADLGLAGAPGAQ